MIQFNGSVAEVMQQSRYPPISQSKETHVPNHGNLRWNSELAATMYELRICICMDATHSHRSLSRKQKLYETRREISSNETLRIRLTRLSLSLLINWKLVLLRKCPPGVLKNYSSHQRYNFPWKNKMDVSLRLQTRRL